MKIDLVYLWCDGNDPSWRARRANYLVDVDTSDEQTFCEGRFVDNDDLLYSLRSVEMYAPWINHIYIVTDNQRPSWLNLNNPKLSVVDHTELFPPEVLPLYNSCAIELGIHKIKGLSEHYLYANDDMMLGRAIDPDFFFTKDGRPICRFHRINNKRPLTDTYKVTIDRVQRRVAEDFNDSSLLTLYANHQIDAYKKSVVGESIERYKSWSDSTLSNRFRTADDMQRLILNLFAVATRQGIVKITNLSRVITRLSIIAIAIGISKGVDSLVIRLIDKDNLRMLKQRKPILICFNDDYKVTDNDRASLKALYSKLYPNKSQFER